MPKTTETANLGRVLKGWRNSEGLGIREAAAIIGTSRSTLSRIERGLKADGDTLAKVIRWLLGENEVK